MTFQKQGVFTVPKLELELNAIGIYPSYNPNAPLQNAEMYYMIGQGIILSVYDSLQNKPQFNVKTASTTVSGVDIQGVLDSHVP